MKSVSIRLSLAAAAILLGSLACESSSISTATAAPTLAATTAAPTEPATITEAPTAAPVSSEACQNPFYPVIEGASWEYAGTWSIHGPLSLTRSIAEVHADGFSDQDVWSTGLTRAARWTCKDGNLQVLDLGTAAGTVSSTSMQLVADNVVADGYIIPAAVNPGDTWTETLDITGKAVISQNTSAPAHNQATVDCTAGDTESVTVAAGTFEALKIDCNVHMTVTVKLAGLNLSPTEIKSAATSWFAPSVGLVKAEATSDLESYSYELQSYTIP
jgi:hypothetical protein